MQDDAVAKKLEEIRALSLADRDEEALARCRALAAELSPEVSVNLRAHVWSNLAQMLLHAGRGRDAFEAVEAGLADPKLTDRYAERAELLRSRSAALAGTGDLAGARACLYDAVRIFRERGDVARAAGAYTALQVALWNRGRLKDATAVGEEGLLAARAVEATPALAAIAHNQSLILVELRSLEEALACGREALAARLALADPGRISYAYWNLGYIHGQRGELAAAGDAFGHAVRFAREAKDDVGLAFATKAWGEAVYRGGDTQRGRALLEEARALFRGLPQAVDPLTNKDNLAMIDEVLRGGRHWTA
ncbi:MAG: hypothetical protein HY557_03770 [Euryarchaeota archaeon]|nr:hypothetical protein [Euryarchaeota archaeon]